jgi:dTDP-4-amino-4,6-dideoxygalactose transaminase
MIEESKYKIFLSPPYQSGEEHKYLEEVLRSNWLAPGGQFVQALESSLQKLTKRKHCLALNTGTAALHLALKVLEVGPEDHVICQTFSYVATANPIAYLGATPVFIDSELETWNMDPQLLETAIRDLKNAGIRPKAIIYTHIYGFPAKVDEIIKISKKYEIPIIEDAAEALGTKVGGKSTGRFGDISVFSFNGNKIITTSGGGALLTDNESWAVRARDLASQSRDKNRPFSHTEIGFNYQMSNVSAALGLAQFQSLDHWVERKRSIFANYLSFFQEIGSYKFLLESKGEFSNRWLSVFLAPDSETRDKIVTALEINQIESRRFWKPLHLLKIYPSQRAYISDVSITLFDCGFCLPSGVGLTEIEQSTIKRIIKLLY